MPFGNTAPFEGCSSLLSIPSAKARGWRCLNLNGSAIEFLAMTQDHILNGRLICEIGIARVWPPE